MSDTVVSKPYVAVIGAGPAGLYGAQQLVKLGARVVIFNRDIKPGGLAEYGIYPDKYKMKDGLRAQFDKILALPEIEYFGNVPVGEHGALSLADIQAMGFDAVLVTVGAQGTKWLGLPGEKLRGVYHSKEIVYHYNKLPPFSTQPYKIGRRVIVIGVGNVMMDLAHWLIREFKVDSVTAVARRGPAEIKFDKKEFETVGANVDLNALDAELARCAPYMLAAGQDPAAARAEILAGLPRALPPVSTTRFQFKFLASPREVCGENDGCVHALEVEENELVRSNGDTKAKGLGRAHEIPCDTVIFAIGDQVDAHFGLPVQRAEFVKNPAPRFPVEGASYEAYDPQTQQSVEGVFVAGWARQASTGLVGVARKDGANGANAVGEYLKTLPHVRCVDVACLQARMKENQTVFVTLNDLKRLAQAEKAQAQARGLHEWKFAKNEEMLNAMGLSQVSCRVLVHVGQLDV
ncbi:MAG: FAD-dependent oxidoreductase [Chloroflexi bacterium]|nr:FAD-dependent oxidoreductase [Chloroflexota bacterium]